MSAKLEDLPDYPSLKQLRDVLWGNGGIRGAAVMVGAGFSRCAIKMSEVTPTPPLWSTFEEAMAGELYPGQKRFYDPLKLAEEYRASLGAHALEALIRSLVPDDQWQPSSTHSRLLGLPWVDVLTTNWDTLLERTSLEDPDRTYDVVRTVQDIALTQQPRIVKLHGSFPSHRPFIFTAEEFRTYPRNFPAFINLAQQVLLENDLCLIGFSGDDPNFLQWSGWVRDQLGSSARRIRLVGALHLSVSQRQVLEQRNVTPIDLSPLVEGFERNEAHEAAAKLFLEFLWEGKPKPRHVWQHTYDHKDPDASKNAAELIDDLIKVWAADRKQYPGWLVAPSSERHRLLGQPTYWRKVVWDNLSQVDAELRSGVLCELAWRYEIALRPLDPATRECFQLAFGDAEREFIPIADRVRVANLLAIDARHHHEWDSFEKWSDELKSIGSDDAVASAKYQLALRAKGEFDFQSVLQLVEGVRGQDPVWGLRQAYLYCSVLAYDEASAVIRQTKAEIHRRRSRENKSVWLLSREAWASWIYRSVSMTLLDGTAAAGVDTWSSIYHAVATDPWDHVYDLDRVIAEESELRSQEAIAREPRFDAGAYRDRPKPTRFFGQGWTGSNPVEQAVCLAEYVGIPDRIKNVGVLGDRIARAIAVAPVITEDLVLLGAVHLRDHSEGLINVMFGRVSVARLSSEAANRLVERLKMATEYALKEISRDRRDWIQHARLYMEVLSRLAVIQPADEAATTFKWAMKLSENYGMSHWWLSEPLNHLLYRSLEVIPSSSRKEMAYDALCLKLPVEQAGGGIENDWPELSEEFSKDDFSTRDIGGTWAWRLSQLIDYVRDGDTLNRTRALLRLMPVYEADRLTEGETSALASAIWSKRLDGDGLPAELDVYPHVFLQVPEPVEGTASYAFRKHIIEPLARGELTPDNLIALKGASAKQFGVSFSLSPDEALSIFDSCISWRPLSKSSEPHGLDISTVVGSSLVWAVCPQLTPKTIDGDRSKLWLEAISERSVPSFLQTAVFLLEFDPSHVDEVTMILRKALAAKEESVMKSGLNAIFHFVRRHKAAGLPVPASLSADVAGMCALRRETGLLDVLSVTRHLVASDLIVESDVLRIIDSLEIMFEEFDYKVWDMSDRRTNMLTLLRAECVRLALALERAGRVDSPVKAWVGVKDTDVFPEVRFADLSADP